MIYLLIICATITVIVISSFIFSAWIMKREDEPLEKPQKPERCPALIRKVYFGGEELKRCQFDIDHTGPHHEPSVGWFEGE
jgi:hypothetical protein